MVLDRLFSKELLDMDRIEIALKGKSFSVDATGSDLILFMVAQDKNGGASASLDLIGNGIEHILPPEALSFDEDVFVTVFEDHESVYERDLRRFHTLEDYLKKKGLI